MRPKPLLDLLESIQRQTFYPSQLIIVDGSTNEKTKSIFEKTNFKNLEYYKVNEADRGLTKQRNFGVQKIAKKSDVVCFLDDDSILLKDYFKEVIQTFINNPDITGVGGVAVNENRWFKKDKSIKYNSKKYYEIDGYIIKEGQRNVIRNYLGLASDKGPGVMPLFSNSRTFGFPLTGKIYEVDLLIGMSFSFHRKVFESIKFSTYFEGYGLYEDADYSIRALKFGKNVINTKAQLNHFHHPDGRPNKFSYGTMVVRNGWYIWRVKYPKPSIKSRIKWNAIALVLAGIRFLNIITSPNKKAAFTDGLGRIYGLISLIVNKPKVV